MIKELSIPAILTDLDGNCIESSTGWHEFSGLNAEESLGNGWKTSFHSEDRMAFEKNWLQSVLLNTGENRHRRLINGNGQIFWVYASETPVTDNSGEVTGYLFTIVNIAKEIYSLRLHKSDDNEAGTLNVLESVNDPIVSLDLFGNIQNFNRVAEILFGYRKDEVLHKSFTNLIADSCKENFMLEFDRIVKTRETVTPNQSSVWDGIRKNKGRLSFKIFFTPFRENSNIFFYGMIRECSYYQKDNNRLSDFQYTIHCLFQYAFEPITPSMIVSKALDLILSISWIPNLGRGMIFVYDPVEKRLNLSSYRGIDKSKIIKCASIELGHCLCGRAVRTNEIIINSNSENKLRNMADLQDDDDFRYIIIPITYGDEIIGVFNIYLPAYYVPSTEDRNYLKIFASTLAGILKWRQSEDNRKKTEMANREKSEFLANMSHEMRTPMNAIIGLADLALSSCQGDKTRDYINKISKSSNSLLMLVNDILDLSKIEAGLMELRTVDFTLREVFDQLTDVFVDELGKKDIDLFYYISYEWELYLRGDEQRLKQIMINLIGNAVKFTETGKIEVFVKAVDQNDENIVLQFSVRDTGIGIGKEVLDGLFRPYTQGDNSITRKYGGSGLGLAISKQLTERMNGKIWVESKEGEGSTFFFEIPFYYHSIDCMFSKMAASEGMTGLKILLITSDPTVEFTLKQAFEMFTFVAMIADSCDKAAELIKEHSNNGDSFDLIIFDWNYSSVNNNFLSILPDGKTAASSKPKIILLIPASKDDEVFLLKYAFSADSIISKPINYSYLFDSILTVFGKDHPKIYKKNEEKIDLIQVVALQAQ